MSSKLELTEVSFLICFWLFIFLDIFLVSYKVRNKMQSNLDQTRKLLSNTEEQLKKCHYALKGKDFIISEQRKAGMFELSS